MKVITLFDKTEYIISDEQFQNISQALDGGSADIIQVPGGDYVNIKSIARIGEPQRDAYWEGHKLSKDGRSFMRNGIRVYLEKENFEEIEYRIAPHYQNQVKMIESGEQLDQPKKKLPEQPSKYAKKLARSTDMPYQT